MVLAAIAGTCTPARAGGKQPRVFIKPPDRTILQPWQATDRIILKFAESTGVRLRHGELVSLHAAGLGRVKRIFARHGVQPADIRPLFDRPEQSLAAEREEGMARSGQELADLSLYYSIELLSQTDVAGLCDALNNLEIVEAAVPAQRDVPPPTDIAPATPDLRAGQRYRSLTTGGIGVEELAGVPGIDGAGIAFADIEYGWILDHEDLELPTSTVVDSATISNPYNPSHGTAVLGMLVAKDNDYGVTGLTPAAKALVAPITTVEFGSNAARAISNAIANLAPGDVMLIESQAWVCNEVAAYGPLEWQQWIFDAIQTATSLGIIVVAAAGNGYGNGAQNLGVNLDAPSCNGLFDRSVRDSGAIFVGAAEAITRNKTGYSNFGSRVDLQGWGDRNVVTTGFGDLFAPASADIRQLYTATFSGTSSATPMVAAAALAIQGARRAAGEAPLDPFTMRALLVATGQAQGSGGHIGPLPNLPAAVETTLGAIPLGVSIDFDPWSTTNEIDPAVPGLLPVAIHGSSILTGDSYDFDATQVDLSTLRFGPAQASNVATPLVGDIDGDTNIDIIVAFRAEQSGIACDDPELNLAGQTYAGTPFAGTDAITTINCDDGSCHP